MNKFIIELSDLEKKKIWIGYEGEQNHTMVIIRCGAFFAKYPEASAYMTVKTQTSLIYPVELDRDENDLIWNVTRADVSIAGSGKLQLTFTNGTGDDAEIIKSVSGDYEVLDSLDPNGEAPDPVQNWIENAEQTAQEIAENAANLAKEDIVESYGSIAPAIIETASGAIASFSDGADGMLVKKMTVEIDPVQDLHGYDNPWPGGGGKNLFYLSSSYATQGTVTYSPNPATGELTLGGSTPSSQANRNLGEISVSVGEKYFISGTPTNGSTSTSCVRYVFRDTPGGTAVGSVIDINSNGVVVTVPEGATILSIYSHTKENTDPNGIVLKPFVAKSEVALPFEPYENKCNISGRTSADVTRTGKNLFDGIFVDGKYINSNGSIGSQSDYKYSLDYIPVNENTKYTLNGLNLNTRANGENNCNIVISYYNASKSIISQSTATTTYPVIVTTPANTAFVRFHCGIKANNVVFEEGETSTLTIYTYTFPESAGTVYGGTLTINRDSTGTLIADRVCVDLGDLTWSYTAPSSSFPYGYFRCDANGKKYGLNNFITSKYPVDDITTKDKSAIGSSNNVRIYIADTDYSDAASFKSAMSGTQIVYELATPISYDLTAQQVVSLLKGVNNVWADTGDVSLEYPADTKIYIDARVAELQALILENISNS